MAEASLTIFGITLLELMASRGIRHWSVLSQKLAEEGHDFQETRISNWAYGKHAVDRMFPRAVADVLNLSKEERAWLADAYTYGQQVRPAA